MYILKNKVREVERRDNFSCVLCGDKSPLEIHHLDGNRENNTLSNLLLLCQGHHQAIHNYNISLSRKGEKLIINKSGLVRLFYGYPKGVTGKCERFCRIISLLNKFSRKKNFIITEIPKEMLDYMGGK